MSTSADRRLLLRCRIFRLGGVCFTCWYWIVIVCTGNEKQAEYWQQRLESVRGVVLPASSTAPKPPP